MATSPTRPDDWLPSPSRRTASKACALAPPTPASNASPAANDITPESFMRHSCDSETDLDNKACTVARRCEVLVNGAPARASRAGPMRLAEGTRLHGLRQRKEA